ncbi:hypothetical protein CEXT_290231 [Caerostris extrusa]|uniref:Uncharacterized protein n=1 Tax=Caerostris extrusa TaxID=172846 RepID=A0AAV4PS20_CAEEX|nr:hypothetical protein CEXT_290231 [Caerostris extrusa]
MSSPRPAYPVCGAEIRVKSNVPEERRFPLRLHGSPYDKMYRTCKPIEGHYHEKLPFCDHFQHLKKNASDMELESSPIFLELPVSTNAILPGSWRARSPIEPPR